MSNVTEIWPAQVLRYVDNNVKPYLPKSQSEHLENIAKYADEMMRINRKVNADADSKDFDRYILSLAECKKRGVKFLPRQVMKKIFHAHRLS